MQPIEQPGKDSSSKDRYQLLVSLAPIGIHEIDLDGRLVFMNPAGLELMDTTLEKICGRHYLDLVGTGDREQVRQLMSRALEGQSSEFEFTFEFEGRVRSFASSFIPIADASGRVIKLMGITQDMSSRRLIEQERELLIRELAAKNAEFEEFVYTASHELKSPLVTISGFAGILQKEVAGHKIPGTESHFEKIKAAVAAMATMLDQLSELSGMGHILIQREKMPLHEVAREAIGHVADEAAGNSVKIDIPADFPEVWGNRVHLRDVLQNLIDNAIKFTVDRREPVVSIGAREEQQHFVCFVRDNGKGIEPRYHDRIFDLFERLDQQFQGTGVGLARVRRIVEMHGGKVWVESEGPGKGSTFSFSIPKR